MNNMTGVWIGVFIAVIVLGGIFYYSSSGEKEGTGTANQSSTSASGSSAEVTAASYEVLITNKSFSPLRLEIKSGDKVTFKNTDNKVHRPASVPPPLEGSYPGYNESKCGTLEESSIFDSCAPLEPGESYSFVFVEKGDWGYWDKLTPSWTGVIRVS